MPPGPPIDAPFSLYPGHPLTRGTFFLRRDRFTVRCLLENGRDVFAHLPNPGRLWEHLLPGATLLLIPALRGALPWRVVGVESPEGPVMLDTVRANAVVRWLLDRGLVPGFEDARVTRAEAVRGEHRFDFELIQGGKPFLLEVKSCTLFAEGIAMFPDAPTERGRRHLEELARLAAEGISCGVLFFIQSAAVRGFLPDFHTDPAFAETLARVTSSLRVAALGVRWTTNLALELPTHPVPLLHDVLLRENEDRGTLLLALSCAAPVPFSSAADERLLDPGHYLYGEDTPRDLVRTQRRRCAPFTLRLRGTPDPARSTATPLPIRSSVPLAASLLKVLAPLGKLLDANPAEGTFLIRLPGPPLACPGVVRALLQHRMGRLAPPKMPGER